MNAAVVKLAEAAAGAGARGSRTAAEPLNTFGPHPTSGGEMKLLAGRYGAYVTDGTTNATLPKDVKPEELTLEQAIALIDARAAAAPGGARFTLDRPKGADRREIGGFAHSAGQCIHGFHYAQLSPMCQGAVPGAEANARRLLMAP
jgi:DNA topoisomerase-1